MNAEHQALAEYLEGHLKTQSKDLFAYMDRNLGEIKDEFKEVHRRIDTLIDHVDKKNDRQDYEIKNHEARINVLESDYRILTS